VHRRGREGEDRQGQEEGIKLGWRHCCYLS
jgi:hypothetical protein